MIEEWKRVLTKVTVFPLATIDSVFFILKDSQKTIDFITTCSKTGVQPIKTLVSLKNLLKYEYRRRIESFIDSGR